MEPAQEKRKHPRIPARFPVTFRLLGNGPQKILHAQTLDISSGGMSFRNDEFIPHRTAARLEFSHPDRHHPVLVMSEVVRTREHNGGNTFIIGVRFQRELG